jgi:hypothetical protein
MESLNESNVPKAVSTPSLGIDLIQKCLRILHKKFNFQTTKKLNIRYFQCLKRSLAALLENKFPMLISVDSKLATYHHPPCGCYLERDEIDNESMYTCPLTEDTLRQICSVNTTIQKISCGCGILPSTICKALEENQNIQDWGIAELYNSRSSIRKYFYWR